jgi:pimeloyl-ACP methyl ester carboxylesterase
MVDDAQTALHWFQAAVPETHIDIAAAICSGSKVALTLASREPAFTRLLLWSAETMGHLRATNTDQRKTRAMLAVYARKLLRPETWRKLLTGRVQHSMVRKALAEHETRSNNEARSEDQTLRALARKKADVMLIYGASDPDTALSLPAYKNWFLSNGFGVQTHTVPDANHSYYAIDWQSEVLDISQQWLHNVGKPEMETGK